MLQLKGDPESAFSSPDGACLLMKIMERDVPRLLCYHWASFGSNERTEIPWPNQVPPDALMVVSSVGNRQSTHVIFMARREGFCQSLRVRITSKSSEYAFHSNVNNSGLSNLSANTLHNSLIDCHAEVSSSVGLVFDLTMLLLDVDEISCQCRNREDVRDGCSSSTEIHPVRLQSSFQFDCALLRLHD